jgi:general secretion pathway protein D
VEVNQKGSCQPSAVSVLLVAIGVFPVCSSPARAQDTTAVRAVHDSVQVRFVDTDLRAVIQALGRHLPKPVIVGPIPDSKVSLETPGLVGAATLTALLSNLVQSQGLEFTEDSVAFRVGAKPPAPAPLQRLASGLEGDSAVQLFVIRLKHARAGDVAATVNQLFGGGGEFVGAGGLSTNTLSDELRRNQVAPQTGTPAPPAATKGANLSGAVTIVPDGLTNSLLIRASPRDFEIMKQAVDQLDIRPLQVLIEVLIVEAQHNRNFSLGASLFLPPQSIDHGTGTVGGSVTGGSLGDFVLQLLNVGHAQVDATLTAAANNGDVEIISRPVLLASNNTEAHILIGTQQPFVQVSRSLPTDTPTRDQVVQYEPVGTKLTVRPTINDDGYVSLMIQQEVSSATSTIAFGAPVISTREAATQVLVKDGQTIVLGGLRDQEHDKTQGGLPFLSSIPLLGGLFGSASRTNNRTEFYLFLTPRILRTDADADSVTVPRLPTRIPR